MDGVFGTTQLLDAHPQRPEDDTPRLHYADWLETRGQPERAEFIRAQCALAKLGPDRRQGRKERALLEPRERALLAAHGDRWLAPLLAILENCYPWGPREAWRGHLKFRRGFADGQCLPLEAARRVAAAGDGVEPLDRIEVMDCPANFRHEHVATISRWPGAGCVLRLSVPAGTDRDLKVIVGSAHLCNLAYLGLGCGQVTDEGVLRLAGWPLAVSLRTVSLRDNPITDAGALALAGSPYLDRLHRLDLQNTAASGRRVRSACGSGSATP